jgi:ABC-type branched-subunit amino acid transport system substrate-binding protein/predicted MFS family arabinose efflux permease
MTITTSRRRGVLALMAAHCAGMVDLVALPVWVGTLVQHYRLDTQQAGGLATLFLLGAVLASVALAPRLPRLNTRAVASSGFALAALGFAAVPQVASYAAMAALHAASGAAAGAALSVTHGTIARSLRPHRLFAVVGAALGVFAVLFLGATPPLVAAQGGAALFQVFAGVMAAAALLCAWAFPQPDMPPAPAPAGPEAAPATRAQPPLPREVWLGVAGISCMALVQAITFSFLERVGDARGFGLQAITGVLVALGLVNLMPAPLAAWLERRWAPRQVMLAGAALQALLAFTIMNAQAFAAYAAAASVFAAVMIFTHTFAFGLIARLDPSGRALAATPAMLMVGSALGPVLGGTLVKALGFGSLGWAALLIDALALLCVWRLPVPRLAAAGLALALAVAWPQPAQAQAQAPAIAPAFAPAPGQAALRVGVSTPLSGPNAAYGNGLAQGVRLGLAALLAGGVEGRALELLVLDDAGDAQRTLANARQLTQQGVLALTALQGARNAQAALPVLSAAGVPLVGVASSADALRGPEQALVFNLRAGAADEVAALVLHLDTLGVQRIAALAQADALGSAGLENLKLELTRLALRPEALASLPASAGEAEAAQAATRLCSTEPEAVLLALDARLALPALNAARRAGCAQSRFAVLSDTANALAGRREARGLLATQVLPHPKRPVHPLVQAYQRALAAAAPEGATPTHASLEGYVYGRVLAEALRACGRRASAACVQDTLNNRPTELPGWRLRFSPQDRRGTRFVEMSLLDGEGRPIY